MVGQVGIPNKTTVTVGLATELATVSLNPRRKTSVDAYDVARWVGRKFEQALDQGLIDHWAVQVHRGASAPRVVGRVHRESHDSHMTLFMNEVINAPSPQGFAEAAATVLIGRVTPLGEMSGEK